MNQTPLLSPTPVQLKRLVLGRQLSNAPQTPQQQQVVGQPYAQGSPSMSSSMSVSPTKPRHASNASDTCGDLEQIFNLSRSINHHQQLRDMTNNSCGSGVGNRNLKQVFEWKVLWVFKRQHFFDDVKTFLKIHFSL